MPLQSQKCLRKLKGLSMYANDLPISQLVLFLNPMFYLTGIVFKKEIHAQEVKIPGAVKLK